MFHTYVHHQGMDVRFAAACSRRNCFYNCQVHTDLTELDVIANQGGSRQCSKTPPSGALNDLMEK